MKNLTLINNVWKQRVDPNLTTEEKTILENRESSNAEARKVLVESIKNRSLVDVSNEEANDAQALYDSHKLQNSTLIAVDLTLPNGHGIINCRVNNEHKQIRF